MKWSAEAENAVKKVPFFVRNRVRKQVEKQAVQNGRNVVDIKDVKMAKQRFLTQMSSQIKGFQLDQCFGGSGCPNRIEMDGTLYTKIETLLEEADFLGFLKRHVKGEIKFHHEFRVTLSDCPNACSQPQIKDIGIVAACVPKLANETCSQCLACVEICPDKGISLDGEAKQPVIDDDMCMKCGKCIKACPTGTIGQDRIGYRVMLGGKLGRHPALATELPGIYSAEQVLAIVKLCIEFYKKNSHDGKRFAQIFKPDDARRFCV